MLQFNEQLTHPRGLATHKDKIFVADCSSYHVSVFHLDGQFIQTIGSGQLNKPWDVAVTTTDQLLVADYGNNSIFRFTLDGTFVGKFGYVHVKQPAAITTDHCGFIAEDSIHRVSIFEQDGLFIHSFGSNGSAAGQFRSPCGIAISPNHDVYVTDWGNKRVQIYCHNN